MDDHFFAPPPFAPSQALTGLKRQLRDLRLAERGDGFELRGLRVIEVVVGDVAIDARLAKRPAQAPDWQRHTLKSAVDVRRFVDTVKQQLARWRDE